MSEARFQKRMVVVAVEGGPRAFAAADLVRRLVREGAVVRVAVTASTELWLPALTFATLSCASVASSVEEGIALAEEADAVLVMTSGTELIANLAIGRAVDAAGTVFLSAKAPRLVLPLGGVSAEPWVKPLLDALSEDSVVLRPGESAEDAVAALARAMRPRDLAGRRVVVTAGPTREHIDPVRFISNPSSGRMGIALAEAAMRRGALVTLLLGPCAISPPPRVRTLRFETAEELLELACGAADGADLFLAAAAVGDYTPVDPSKEKIKKGEGELLLRLKRTPDVLGLLGRRFREDPDRPVLIGFAAETCDLIDNARRKLESKHLDLVVANLVGGEETGFTSAMNEVTLVDPEASIELPRASKELLAHAILDRALSLLSDRVPGSGSSGKASAGVGDSGEAD